MKKLVLSDIVPARLYEPVRDDMRRRVIAVKKARRIAVGPRVTVVFENRATMIFQVQEMARAEHIDEPTKLQQELDVYNELLPGAGQLSATLFIEVTDSKDIRPVLNQLVGIDEHFALDIAGERIRAQFEPGRSEADRVSSVQYVKFDLSEAAQAALRRPGTSVALVIDHPQYAHRVVVPDETRASLAQDLDG